MAFKIPKEITPQEVAEQLKQGKDLMMLDVRESAEWVEGHVEGAVHIPLGQLMQRYIELDESQEVIIMCRSGNRSGLACELLHEKGYKVINMTGGLSEWSDFNKLVR
ncbi:rhodanese-like domain-containing protein [Paenibacillus illinoisensis]|uniref:Rhodanese-related sulfurtransferase n=1 Tax=Paenibacillus illinoisensis TaxID=59845 RepID=A0A2W0C1U4_9BACL|nr:rhodanese-like domain-containing protein [Paenibacillus illinoisensis]PYY25950.1 Rhodanese-related sulfurtransferase [Paenibacillus illinoisensis]